MKIKGYKLTSEEKNELLEALLEGLKPGGLVMVLNHQLSRLIDMAIAEGAIMWKRYENGRLIIETRSSGNTSHKTLHKIVVLTNLYNSIKDWGCDE